jgi:2-iminoacetate synthase
MFSDLLEETLSHVSHIQSGNALSETELGDTLQKAGGGNRLAPDELVALLSSTFDPSLRRVILDFSAAYERPHDHEVLLLPPLYFSNICENDCLYCDFSANGERLSLDRFENEFNALLDMGYRSIELVSSQDTTLYAHHNPFSLSDQAYAIDGALEYFHIASRRLRESGGGMLTSNIPPLDTISMRQLKNAGLDCFLLWLECFEPHQYARLHYQEGPKANQAFRLDSFERALDAGIEHLAGAFLKGLYEWREEEFVLYIFDTYLKTSRGHGFSIIGTPRLKGRFAESNLVSPYGVSDQDYELNIALDRILFDGILWLQTRESFSFNSTLIDRYGGGLVLTLSSSTAPGGYSKPPTSHSQFPVHKQNLSRSVGILEEAGLRPLFDWDADTLSAFQRN